MRDYPMATTVRVPAVKLVDLLEENEDVQRVHGNFEIDEAVMEQIAAAS